MHKIQQSLVSVIIPLYNSEQFIARAIESVKNQTYSNIEVIVVDDGSTDNSLAIAKQYESRNIHIYSQTNQGAQVARNFGFSHSKGKYIQYLDSDDYLTPRKIEKQVRLLENNDAMTIATSSVYIDDGYKCVLWKMPNIYHDFKNGFELLVNLWYYFTPSLAHGSYLMPRTLVECSGGWDETLLKNQDGEFFSRVLIQAQKVVYAEDEGQVWRIQPNSISHSSNAAKIESVLRSYKMISKRMLSYENSERVKHAIAVAFGSFIINDSNYKYANLALKFIKGLGIEPNYRINSVYFKVLEKIFHPKIAMRIFTCVQKVRGRSVYFSN